MSKRVTLGYVESIVKDISNLYTYYFDHTLFLENEIRVFLKEFEGRRGDRDINALKHHLLLLKATDDVVDKAFEAAKGVEAYNEAVELLTDTIKMNMPKENLHKEHRENIRRQHMALEDQERAKFLAQQQESRAAIDAMYHEQADILRKKYALPSPAATPVSPPTSPATNTTTPQTTPSETIQPETVETQADSS